MKIQIHCIMGNLVPSDFGTLPILETKSQDFSASVAQIWPPNYWGCNSKSLEYLLLER